MFQAAILCQATGASLLGWRTFFRRLGYIDVPTGIVPVRPDDCLRFWVSLLLGRIDSLTPEQRDLVFDEISPYLLGVGDKWSAYCHPQSRAVQSAVEPILLAFADQEWVTWTGYKGWLSLKDGHNQAAPTREPLQTVGYNLLVLCRRNYAACYQLCQQKERRDATDPNHPGQADVPTGMDQS